VRRERGVNINRWRLGEVVDGALLGRAQRRQVEAVVPERRQIPQRRGACHVLVVQRQAKSEPAARVPTELLQGRPVAAKLPAAVQALELERAMTQIGFHQGAL